MQLAKQVADPDLLELCTGYIDAALRLENWTPPYSPLTDKERAFIAFTEQFVTAVGTMKDEQVQDLLMFASADEVYAFVNSIYVTDMAKRLELVAAKVLP
jgi:hypothetical protein